MSTDEPAAARTPKTRVQLEIESQARRAGFLLDMWKLAQQHAEQHELTEEELAYALTEAGNRLQYRLMAEVWRNNAGEVDE